MKSSRDPLCNHGHTVNTVHLKIDEMINTCVYHTKTIKNKTELKKLSPVLFVNTIFVNST